MGHLTINPKHAELVGNLFIAKYHVQMILHGTERAARNLRKQGIPLDWALFILLGKEGSGICGNS